MSPGTLRHRIRRGGPWQRILPGVYLVATGEPTADQRDMAAQLYAGPGGIITGLAALRRHQVRAPQSPIVDVLVSHEVKRAGGRYVRVQRTRNLPAMVAGQWHLSPEDWRRTTLRHDRMTEAGIAVLHFQPSQIQHEAAEVITRIAGALRNGRPAAGIRTVPAAD